MALLALHCSFRYHWFNNAANYGHLGGKRRSYSTD